MIKEEDIPTSYRNTALEMFENIKEQKWRLVAILVSKSSPISVASNDLVKTHPFTHTFFEHRRRHAEFLCLQKAPSSKIDGSIMFVWRFLKNGNLAMAKPCPMCTEMMQEKGVKRVIYSVSAIGQFEMMKL